MLNVRFYEIYTYISVIVDKISILYFVFIVSYIAMYRREELHAEHDVFDLVLLKGFFV